MAEVMRLNVHSIQKIMKVQNGLHTLREGGMTQSPRPARDEQAVSRFVERFAAVMTEAGIPPMAARVLAALLATDVAYLTAADLARLLRASPASISGGVRYLIQLGLVSKEREPGSRRDRYRVIDDIWYQSAIRQDSVLTKWVITASEGLDALGADSPAGRRIGESMEYFAFMQREIPALLARWREYRQSLAVAADQ
jgi:DNA-binding transcriptional regulator GbsR (MarR family)